MPDRRIPRDLRPGDLLLDAAAPHGALYRVLALDMPGPGRLTVEAQTPGRPATVEEWWVGTALLLLARGRYILIERPAPHGRATA